MQSKSVAPLYVLGAALIILVVVLWLVGTQIIAPLMAQLGQIGEVLAAR
jgi:hypothetical protein